MATAVLSCSASRLRHFDCYYCLLMKDFVAVAIFRSASVGDFDFGTDRMFDLFDLLMDLDLVRTNASIQLSATSSSFGSAKIKRFSLQAAAVFLVSARDRAC